MNPIRYICEAYAQMRLSPGDYDSLIDDAFAFRSKKLLEAIMRKRLTESEERMLAMCISIQITFGPGKVNRRPFHEVMAEVENMKRYLQNKMWGCPSGTHDDICRCAERNVA